MPCVRLQLCDGVVQAVGQRGDSVPVAAATGGFQCGGGFAQVVCAHQPRCAFDFVGLPGQLRQIVGSVQPVEPGQVGIEKGQKVG